LAFNNLQRLFLNYGYQEIPLRLSKNKNFLIIDVSLGKNQALETFILDTGASLTSIDQKIEARYKFKKQGKEFITGGAGGNRFLTHKVIIPSMNLGNFSANNQMASIQHYSHIKIAEKPIAGMIGLDFLRQYQAILDVTHKRLFLKLRNVKLVNKKILCNNLLKMRYEPIQLERSPSGHETLLVKINNSNPVRFMLDTGASPSMMLDYKYARNIAVNIKGNPTISKGGSNGIMKIFTAKIHKFSIGSIISSDQSIVITTGLEFAQIGTPIFGVIGLDWMLSHQAVLDASNNLLFVTSKRDGSLG